LIKKGSVLHEAQDATAVVPISPNQHPLAQGVRFSRKTIVHLKREADTMDSTVETKDDFITAANNGIPRIAEAIIAAPPEARIGVIDAVMESYRKLAGDFLGEEETEKWLMDVVTRLEAEVSAKERAETNTSNMDAASLVPEAGILI
jgi:hypothetical protein